MSFKCIFSNKETINEIKISENGSVLDDALGGGTNIYADNSNTK